MFTPENGNIIMADPAELMRDNPAALIVNQETYQGMGAYFVPERLDPPQVVRVATFSASGEEAIKLFVVDGMTRIKYAADHKGTKLPDYPDFSFDRIAVRDITNTTLRNPIYVPERERQEGQNALSIIQYLRAVIPPTVEHAQIAPDRIATFLVNGWEKMVGPETARKFSALAALSLLSDRKVPIATEYLLKQHLSRQERLVADETQEEREKLEKHFLEMGSVIRESKIIQGNIKIAQAAFVLVSAGSEIIGGEKEARKQVYGLLYTPQLEKKLEKYPQGERTEKRLKLGELIYTAFSRAGRERSGIEQITGAIGNILRDHRLDYGTTERILASNDIVGEYAKVQQDINAKTLENYYLFVTQRKELTPSETVLIAQLGRKTYIQDSEIPSLCRVIHEADMIIQRADSLISGLESQRTQFLERGVKVATVDEIIAGLSAARSALVESDSRQSLNKKSGNLKKLAAESQGKIDREIRVHTVGKIVGEIFREARPEVVYYVLRENLVQEAQIKHVMRQLKGLDLDLQARVLNGEIRLTRALQQHDDRRKALLRPVIEVPTTTPQPAPVKEARPDVPVEVKPVSQPVEVEIDKKTVEERRTKLNSERLRQASVSFYDLLRAIDLERGEISKEALEAFNLMLTEAGKLRFGRPNLVQIMEEGYPQLLRQIRALREARLHQEQIDLSKDTQTQI